MARSTRGSSITGIAFHHPSAFWLGSAAMAVGVTVHLPEFLSTADTGYRMAGLPLSGTMVFGMLAILGGLGLAAYGLVPRRASLRGADATSRYQLRAMDDAPLTAAHWGLLTVLGVALVVDVMKPATVGFVMPGLRREYGLTTPQATALPLLALTGTTVGSLVWGHMADRIGRRASILLASLMFVGTAICGAMPTFQWNLVMCFLMGASAGGMLPIVYALMAESVPAGKRGWLVVLHGGLGTVGGYLAASGFAALLEPHFGWRVLWFLGLPTGALMLLLNRWIPESPRFLLERGRVQEASDVMARYGVVLEVDDDGSEPAEPVQGDRRPRRAGSAHRGLAALFRHPYGAQSLTVVLYGLAWGLVNWGFITLLPTILGDVGVKAASVNALLFLSAVLAIPGTVLVAYLYGHWSSRKSMVAYAMLAALALVGFAILTPGDNGENRALLTPLLVLLLTSSGGVIAMLSPYTAEVYPTSLRGTGSGLAAGSSKIGGVLGPPLIAAVLVWSPGFTAAGLVVAAPMVVAAVALAVKGIETRGRRLEEIELVAAAGPGSSAV